MTIATVADLSRVWAADTPDNPMFTLDDRTLTYGEFHRSAAQVANAMREAGVGEQDRVALIDKNSIEFFQIFFGATFINAVAVAINFRLAAREMAYIVNDSTAKILFVHEEFAEQLEAMIPELEHNPKIVVIGSSADHTTFDDFYSGQPETDPGLVGGPTDVAVQMYTSGTTGLPKGAQLTNGNLMAGVGAVETFGVDAATKSLVAMPLFHIGGSGWALAALVAGGHDIIVRELDPVAMLKLISDKKITEAFLVPAVLQFFLICPTEGLSFDSLRTVFYGASPITQDILVKSMEQLGCKFGQVYGLTETSGAVTMLSPENHDPGGPREHLLRSAGAPLPWVKLRIVDTDSGDELPEGEVGEVWIHGPQNMLGYWNLPDATASALPGEGWFCSGDAGYIRDGHLFIHDRVKDMIISGGENVYPAEIENVLMGHDAINDVAVIGVPDDKWGETPKAVVVVAPDSNITADEIIEYTRANLARFKCPTSVDFVTEIPRNPTGKILKRELRAPYWEGRERSVN